MGELWYFFHIKFYVGPSQNTKVNQFYLWINQVLFWSTCLSSLVLLRLFMYHITGVKPFLIVNLLGFKISEIFVEEHRMYSYEGRIYASKSPSIYLNCFSFSIHGYSLSENKKSLGSFLFSNYTCWNMKPPEILINFDCFRPPSYSHPIPVKHHWLSLILSAHR